RRLVVHQRLREASGDDPGPGLRLSAGSAGLSIARGAGRGARPGRDFMERVSFGQTGLKVSRLCLGGMSLGSSAWKGWVQDEAASAAILRRAFDLGINFFDTADWYSLGRSEEVIGRNLLKMARRDELVLA